MMVLAGEQSGGLRLAIEPGGIRPLRLTDVERWRTPSLPMPEGTERGPFMEKCFGCGAETKTFVGAVPICVSCMEKNYGGRSPQEGSSHDAPFVRRMTCQEWRRLSDRYGAALKEHFGAAAR